uniref:Myeloid-derived growth factor n=1 Tax=Oryzias latipes TaxID=8090 RepID=A0A3B3IIT8_ORYLA
MTNPGPFCVHNMAFLLLCGIIAVFVAAEASSEKTKTVEFNVKPGGVVHSFTEGVRDYECTFTYASQGGTNEQWLMSVGLSDDDSLFSCSVWRPQGKSYLFFTQFKAELKGTRIEYANAYSQIAAGGQSDVPLKPEEFTVAESTGEELIASSHVQSAPCPHPRHQVAGSPPPFLCSICSSCEQVSCVPAALFCSEQVLAGGVMSSL